MAKDVEALLRAMLKDMGPPLLVGAAPELVAAANTLYRQPFKDSALKRNALALLRDIVLLPGLVEVHPQLFEASCATGLHTTAALRVVRFLVNTGVVHCTVVQSFSYPDRVAD